MQGVDEPNSVLKLLICIVEAATEDPLSALAEMTASRSIPAFVADSPAGSGAQVDTREVSIPQKTQGYGK